MSDPTPGRFEENEKEAVLKEYLALAREMSERREALPFPGLDPALLVELKTVEDQFPGLTTPIDELVERFTREGLKVAFGVYGENSVYVMPAQASDPEIDGLFPRHLAAAGTTDETLGKLIAAGKKYKALCEK